MMKNISRYCVIPLVLHAGIASAEVDDTFLRNVSDINETIRIETELANALDTRNRQALQDVADRIMEQDGEALAELETGFSNGGQELAGLAFRLDVCFYAGLYIRSIAMMLSDDTQSIRHSGSTWLIEDNEIGGNFVDSMRQCELIKRLPASTRRIGAAVAE